MSTHSPTFALGGNADHAHLTRTCRAFLGRTPSELGMPEVIEAW